jgi:AraC-like DNA-binding protein
MRAPFLEVIQQEPATAGMRAMVTKIFAVHGTAVPSEVLHSVPCDASVLHVHLRGDPELDLAHGDCSFFTGIRHGSALHSVGGHFLTLFATLTPLGAVALLEGASLDGQNPCIPLGHVLGVGAAQSLELAVSAHLTPGEALAAFGCWLEDRLLVRQTIPEAAWRAARVQCELSKSPRTRVIDVAQRQAVSQRQLERDMQRWFNLPPKQFALTAQFQRLLHLAARGESLSGIAAEAGFVDQAHMTRTVKRFTGMTPRQLLHAQPGPIASLFQNVSPGARIFV